MKKAVFLLLSVLTLTGCEYYGDGQGASILTPAEYANMNQPVAIPPPPNYYVPQSYQYEQSQPVQPADPAPPYYYQQPAPAYQPSVPMYQPPQYQVVTRSHLVCQSVVGNTLTGATMGSGLGAIIGVIAGGHHSVMRGAWIGAASGGGLGALQQPQCRTVYY